MVPHRPPTPDDQQQQQQQTRARPEAGRHVGGAELVRLMRAQGQGGDPRTAFSAFEVPPWWGRYRSDEQGRFHPTDPLEPHAAGPNGLRLRILADHLQGRGIREDDVVWVNPDKPAEPGDVVLAEGSEGKRAVGVWRHDHPHGPDRITTEGPPPWERLDLFVAGEWGGFRVVGPVVWVEEGRHASGHVLSHPPLPAGWREPPAPRWAPLGHFQVGIAVVGEGGRPLVLECGGRLYLAVEDQDALRRRVAEHQHRAMAAVQEAGP